MPRQAAGYAVAFSIGLFVTIAVIGVICALLGRMLGDIGSWWQILIGGVLIGLLVSFIVGSWWSARAQPLNLAWLNAHDRVMVWLLILAMFTLGVFVAHVVLR